MNRIDVLYQDPSFAADNPAESGDFRFTYRDWHDYDGKLWGDYTLLLYGNTRMPSPDILAAAITLFTAAPEIDALGASGVLEEHNKPIRTCGSIVLEDDRDRKYFLAMGSGKEKNAAESLAYPVPVSYLHRNMILLRNTPLCAALKLFDRQSPYLYPSEDFRAAGRKMGVLPITGAARQVFPFQNGQASYMACLFGLLLSEIRDDFYPVFNWNSFNDLCRSCRDQKVFLMGREKEIQYMEFLLALAGIRTAGTYGGRCSSKEVPELEDPDELFYEDPYLCRILVVPSNYSQSLMGVLIERGFPRDRIIQVRIADLDDGGAKKIDLFDLNIGFSRKDDLPGFSVWEYDSGTQPVTIVCLGGSTTDATYNNLRSYSEFLYHRLKDLGIGIRILCGGVIAYNSSQELKKFFRDVLPMKPDIVISYGGYNDYCDIRRLHGHPFATKYQMELLQDLCRWRLLYTEADTPIREITAGLPDPREPDDIWIDNMRVMSAVCREYGISFFPILQPTLYTHPKGRERKDLFFAWNPGKKKRLQRLSDRLCWKVKKQPFIHDFSESLNHFQEPFYDECHVYEYVNDYLSGLILNLILPEIRKRNGMDKI